MDATEGQVRTGILEGFANLEITGFLFFIFLSKAVDRRNENESLIVEDLGENGTCI